MKFNNQEITQESILKTRQFFMDLSLECMDQAKAGKLFVNDLGAYIKDQEENIEKQKLGLSDHTFTFRQRAYFIQTGECIAFLPK